VLDPEVGEATRARARDLFLSVFETDGEAETALVADAALVR